jgi:lipopolysaccharide/colanic/teichoic acid biosynthesis glycosyltransferase
MTSAIEDLALIAQAGPVDDERQFADGWNVAVETHRHDQETARILEQALEGRRITPFSRSQAALKRTLDIVGASLFLLLAAPALLLVALAVKLDSGGPVLFRQERVGRDNRAFRILKFRSMTVGNDDSQHRAYVAAFIAGDAEPQGGVFKLVDDSRVTRVGRLIRRYSIDELPQFWNVLRGDMSLVGPRPALPREVELYDDAARQRLAVKPGITGLWQVSGRCELSFLQMIELDVAYWRDWSLRKDLSILCRTPRAAVGGRGAA